MADQKQRFIDAYAALPSSWTVNAMKGEGAKAVSEFMVAARDYGGLLAAKAGTPFENAPNAIQRDIGVIEIESGNGRCATCRWAVPATPHREPREYSDEEKRAIVELTGERMRRLRWLVETALSRGMITHLDGDPIHEIIDALESHLPLGGAAETVVVVKTSAQGKTA